jgi:phage tail protein X
MNMEVTRNVILDLLPLYLAGEVSADTTALVENYLKADPGLAQLAQQAAATGLSEVPIPLTKEDAMEAYVKATQRMLMRTIGWGAVFVVVFVGIIALVMALIYGGFR